MDNRWLLKLLAVCDGILCGIVVDAFSGRPLYGVVTALAISAILLMTLARRPGRQLRFGFDPRDLLLIKTLALALIFFGLSAVWAYALLNH